LLLLVAEAAVLTNMLAGSVLQAVEEQVELFILLLKVFLLLAQSQLALEEQAEHLVLQAHKE
jgi:hypothetical protein